MTNVISTVDQITPEWLTGVLHRQGLLSAGQVLAIESQPNAAFNSIATHLQATFSPDVPQETPSRFLLKCNLKQAWAIPAGVLEATFYQTVTSLPDHPAITVPCYDAVVDPVTSDSHILLQDLSESHVMPEIRGQRLDNLLAEEYLEQAIDTLARFHAFWWQNPLLGTGVAQVGSWLSNAENVAILEMRRRQAWQDLCEKEADWFPPHLTTLYETVLDQMVALWQRHVQPRLVGFAHLTLTHNDSYLANFLCPRPDQTGNTYLIDWQSPAVNIAASDLVNMMATFWTRAYRAEREERMLRRYHRVLQENGVSGYAWGDLVADYQYAIIGWLLQPLQDRIDGSGKEYWYPKMQCLADAFEDWDCIQLLEHQ